MDVDPRRRQEVADSQMISEDFHQVANLSNTPINRQFDSYKYAKYTTKASSVPWRYDDEIEMY